MDWISDLEDARVKRILEYCERASTGVVTPVPSENEWQRIETVPEDEEEVLLVDESGYIYIGHYEREQGLCVDRNYIDVSPSAWMPLPSPPGAA